MTIILLIIIIGILVFVHELGHFSVAKFFNIRVDEFGMGLPPRAKKLFSKNGTDYTLNWIPFGGFVKIYGEDSLSTDPATDPDYQKSFIAKKWWQQIAVLIAGVTMNFLFAWVLFTLSFMIGAPTITSGIPSDQIQNPQLTVLQVVKGSPADQVGIVPGSKIIEIESLDGIVPGNTTSAESFIQIVQSMPDNTPVRLFAELPNGQQKNFLVIPDDTNKIGVAIDTVGIYREGLFSALVSGAKNTVTVTGQTVQAFVHLIGGVFTGTADMDSLTGPVGLVSVVGDAQQVGFVYVIILTAMISVNLAVLNLFPFPALDGGRIVVVLIETITRRKIKPIVVQWINGIGFMFLIGLMIVITIKDVIKLF